MDLISKYDIIEKIVSTNNEVLLNQIKHLIEDEELEDWSKLPVDLKKSIQKGIAEANKGQLTAHSAVIKKMRKSYAQK